MSHTDNKPCIVCDLPPKPTPLPVIESRSSDWSCLTCKKSGTITRNAGSVSISGDMCAKCQAPYLAEAPPSDIWTPTPENIEKLFAHLAHGDTEHRRWLREHLYLFFGVAT